MIRNDRIAVCTKPWNKNTNVIFWMTKHPLLEGHFGNGSVMQKLSCYDIYNRIIISVFYFDVLAIIAACKHFFSLSLWPYLNPNIYKRKKPRQWNLRAHGGDKVALKRLDSWCQSSAISVHKEQIARLSCREQEWAVWYVPAFLKYLGQPMSRSSPSPLPGCLSPAWAAWRRIKWPREVI